MYCDFDRINTTRLVVGGEGAHRDVRFEGVHPRAVVDDVSLYINEDRTSFQILGCSFERLSN